MKSNSYILVSIVGILSVLFLQAMWIRQTVLYTETNMVEDINKVVVKSMFSEVYKRFIYVPAETRIAGAPDLSTPKFQGIEYIEEGVYQYDFTPMWFKYDEELDEYKQVEKEPDFINPKTVGFAIG